MFAFLNLMRGNALSAWEFFCTLCKTIACCLGLIPAQQCIMCFFEFLASKIVFETVNALLQDFNYHVAFFPHLIVQQFIEMEIYSLSSLIALFCKLMSCWTCLRKLSPLRQVLEYAQIAYCVLNIFTSITPQIYCFAKQIENVGFSKLFTKFRFHSNAQLQCANNLSSAFPSTLALQASLKPDIYVGLTTVVMSIACLMLKKCKEPQIKTLGRIASELFKIVFIEMFCVAIVLGIHGKLHWLNSIFFMLMYFVIALLPIWFNTSAVTWNTGIRCIIPRYFCPCSHTVFLKPAVLDKTLKLLNFEMQDEKSEKMLICYGFLPGDCPQNLHNTSFRLLSVAIDFFVLFSFLTHVVFAEPKDANKDADYENKLQTLTRQQEAKAKKQLLEQMVADFNQDDMSNISETLQKFYFCLTIVNRLLAQGYFSF